MKIKNITTVVSGVLLAMVAFGVSLGAKADTSQGVTVDVNANILANTCSVSVENGSVITLPVVKPDWFSNGLTPTTDVSGKSFALLLKDCGTGNGSPVDTLHLTFAPQSGANISNQVFPNDLLPTSGGAQGVGIVIFSDQYRTNVINSTGIGEVDYDITGKTRQDITNRYTFYARYQKTDVVVPGRVTANIIIGAYYD